MINKLITKAKKPCKIIILFGMILFAFALTSPSNAHASLASNFQAGRIIDDIIFTNKDFMNKDSIQNFLNSKVSNCDTDGTQPASEFGRSDLTHAQYASMKGWSAPPYVCLKNFTENGKSAAQIIFELSQQYNINPAVLIVLLQKEQGLVTDTWPLASQYRTSTGYGCPDTAACDSQYYGFTNQVAWSNIMFRSIMNDSQSWYTPYILGNNYIQWSPNSSCGGTIVNIQNRATKALYNYTPYQPNQAALNAGYGSGDGCSAYGNRNFYLYFNDWFGSTYSAQYNGVDFSDVYKYEDYMSANPDLQKAYDGNPGSAISHFILYGMDEGRVASNNFNVISYKNRYPDLRRVLGNNLRSYYLHYMNIGKQEGRIATGDEFNGTSFYNGIDYSAVYNFDYYENNNPDIKTAFGLDDNRTLSHFINYGMAEGRQGGVDFNINSYKSRYNDLRQIYVNNVRAYAVHYIVYGKQEGRIALGDYIGGTSIYNGINHSAVYNFDYYEKNNPDIKAAFGFDDSGALSHFINYGMAEGRQGSVDFNVNSYKTNYIDLRNAFGQNLKPYYLHYINYGKAEARTAI